MIKAPRKRVFEAFASVDELMRWFCPEGCGVSGGEMDFRVGGGYRLHIFTSDVGDVDLVGEFEEIVVDERLVYTWEWQRNEQMNFGKMLVTVDFTDVDGGTEVKINHCGLPGEEACVGHRKGWDGSFDKLDRRYESP